MSPAGLSARALAERLARRELSALQLVEAFLEAVEAREGELHAWAALDPDFARRQARACDAGAVRGPLHGVPLAVKDILDTADLPTGYGTEIYRGHRPAWDAACVALARRAGAVLLGKTVTTELATMSPALTVHPLDPRRTPGGSSSGSAAAVAAGMVPFAYGTQTVGSIIRPAAYCGVVGYKPSFGTLSRAGMKMASESLDTVGVIAATVDDAALLVEASAGITLPLHAIDAPRLGVCRSPNWSHMAREAGEAFERCLEQLGRAGATLVEREMSREFEALDAAASCILAYEIARSFAHEVAHHRARLSAVLREVIDRGAAIAQDEYAAARALARRCRAKLAELAADVDALITPSATGEAPLGLGSTGNTAMNRLWTLLHGPCVTVPAGRGPAGMPLGVQIVGLPGADRRTLAAASWAQTALARGAYNRKGGPS